MGDKVKNIIVFGGGAIILLMTPLVIFACGQAVEGHAAANRPVNESTVQCPTAPPTLSP